MRRTVNFYAIRFSVVKLYAFMYIFQSISIGMCSQNFFYLLFRHTAAVILYRKNKFFRLLLTADFNASIPIFFGIDTMQKRIFYHRLQYKARNLQFFLNPDLRCTVLLSFYRA